MRLPRARRLFYSGGPKDGTEIPFSHPLPEKIRVAAGGRIHRYVLEDEPKLAHPNGGGNLRIEYRYEGPGATSPDRTDEIGSPSASTSSAAITSPSATPS